MITYKVKLKAKGYRQRQRIDYDKNFSSAAMCVPYPFHGPAQLTFKKKEKDFRVLGNSIPRRNGFV